MIQKNNICAFPFYNSISEQHHRKPYSFGAVYPLIASKDTLLPFQFVREKSTVCRQVSKFNFSEPDELFPEVNVGDKLLDKRIYSGPAFLNMGGSSVSGYVVDGLEVGVILFQQDTIRIAVDTSCLITKITLHCELGMEFASPLGNFITNTVTGDILFTPTRSATAIVLNVAARGLIFSITVEYEGPEQINTCTVKDLDGNIIRSNMASALYANGMGISLGATHERVIYSANPSQEQFDLAPGFYYLHMKTSSEEYFSEVFNVVYDVSNYLCLSWNDNTDLQISDDIEYLYSFKGNKFVNRAYFDVMVGKPEYNFDEEGKNRDGFLFVTKQISKKTYKFSTVMPEYLCDALRLVRLSDNIEIIDRYGELYKCDSFLMEPAWEDQGDLASVEVEFTSGTVIKKIATGWPSNQ